MSPPQRICSLLPSATEIIAQLGLADRLVGVSAECRWPAEVIGKPVVSAAKVDTATLSSAQIDRLVRESTADGGSLYAIDAETLSLDPRTFAEVADTVLVLARRLGVGERGEAIVAEMWRKVAEVHRAVAGRPRPRVFLAEWVEPPYCGGHWIPEMIEMAGGEPLLGRAGEPAYALDWQEVRDLQPDLVVVAPCGFDAEQAAVRAAELSLPCRTVAVDADGCYSRPAPRLADGVRQLAHLMHPDAVEDPGLPAIELHGRPARYAARP